MYSLLIIVSLLLLLRFAAAQVQSSAVSSSADIPVPTGTPVPGNYTGPLRPQVHFSPPQFFMNDPNGMFRDANGTWHLYYQYNPTGLVAGNQHWGHATSRDLYHWNNQPIALFPPADDVFVFSGSAVTDPNNTSGFFPSQNNGVVAIYTLAAYPDGLPGPQTQNIAYSTDGGFTFTPYSGNPVIGGTDANVRDPKVVRFEDRWVLVLAYAQEFGVGIFTSPDLKTWTHASNFSRHGLLGNQWECPNMVQVPVRDAGESRWVLLVSINPGAPIGGSITQYYIGDFNGTHFVPDDQVARIADFGKDNYAGQFFYGTGEGEAVSVAWASNWQYTGLVPTAPEGWRSVMSLPRRNFITNVPGSHIGSVLGSEPYDLGPVLGESLLSTELVNQSTVVDYSFVASNAVYISINMTNIPHATNISGQATLNMTLVSPLTGESVSTGFFLGGDYFIDRGRVRGFDNPFFTDKFSVSNAPNGTWRFEAVVDRSILEVFLNGGRYSATTTFFPEQPLTILSLASAVLPAGVQVAVGVWALESAWARYQDEQGIVYGNFSDMIANGSAKARRQMMYEARF